MKSEKSFSVKYIICRIFDENDTTLSLLGYDVFLEIALTSLSNIVLLEYGAVFLKILIFIFMSITHCHHVTQHVNVYTNMSSLCLIFYGLHQNTQIMVYLVVTS